MSGSGDDIKATRSKAVPRRSARYKKASRSAAYISYASYAITVALIFALIYSQYNYYAMGCLQYSTEAFASMPLQCRLSSANATIYLSLFLPSIVFTYLLFKKKTLGSIISDLGLSKSKFTLRNIGIGVGLFAAILLLSLGFGIFSEITGVQLPTHVQQLLSGMPLYLLLFSFIIAPIDEEILFRGFLVPRIGIIASALIFALLHFSYASISEVAAAFVFGILAGYVFKRTGSLYASITGHMLVNMLTIVTILAISYA
ncbi:MAG: CPBP family intramembrane metalloprotease [Candidatus Marsarchaeota archaeon]|nr:CPBP family intramembrane metalloprotease [Candidatus Marsarchaeota archaeon]MCL5418331.1 CPBP family intramembrane metalloprotease [Candidatus Marsarchaeota archaeon]